MLFTPRAERATIASRAEPIADQEEPMSPSPQNLSEQPFGAYRLPSWARVLVNLCQLLPHNGFGKKAAFLIRKPVLQWVADPVDVRINGLHCRLYPHQNLSDKRLLTTPYLLDGAERAFLQQHLPPDAVVVDVGANIGAYTMLLLRERSDLRVLAIEAEPGLATRLSDNVKLSGLDNHCDVHRAAITDKPGVVRLFQCPENEGQNSLVSKPSLSSKEKFVDVEGQPLREVLAQWNIRQLDLLKMDIEGHEHPVLEAFFKTTALEHWPTYIQVEQYRNEETNKAVNLCLEHGYGIALRTRLNVVLERATVRKPEMSAVAEPEGFRRHTA